MGQPLAFFEITSPDPARARDFYTTLFGWAAEAPAELGGYTLVDTGAEAAAVGGGIGAATPDGMPPGVLVYFRVDDLAATLDRAGELGGSTVLPPMALPADNGSIAVLSDPDGNAVGLWA
jgi:predicted enzyme related to lactoylglutathione lyase